MITHPTLRYMVSEVDQYERRAAAEVARRVPQAQPRLLARLVAGLREWRQPVDSPAGVAQPSVASGRLVEAGS
jgi:hypothetical protein